MRASRTSGSILLAVGLAVAGGTGCGQAPAAIIGERVPDYRAVSLAGESRSLRELRGRVVLLNVWSVWCAPCRAEMPVLEALRRMHDRGDLEIVGLNVDRRGDEGTIDRFVRASRIGYAVWRDPNDSFPGRRPSDGIPASYLIARDGTLVWARLGALRRDDLELGAGVADALARRDDTAVRNPVQYSLHLSRVVRGENPEMSVIALWHGF